MNLKLPAKTRENYRNRPRFMEILDKLDGRTIFQTRAGLAAADDNGRYGSFKWHLLSVSRTDALSYPGTVPIDSRNRKADNGLYAAR